MTATIDFGDGGGAQPLTGTVENVRPDASFTFAVTHVYADPGTRIVKVCGKDDDGSGCNSASVTITNVPPQTTITDGPSGAIRDSTPAFGFTSDEPGTFRCSIDGGEPFVCTSPHTTAELDDGEHTFAVFAIDTFDGRDESPATRMFRVDTTPPETSITSGPSGSIDERTATFGLGSSEPGSTFECRLDGGEWVGCQSPHTTVQLADGEHTFAVRATDEVGNTDQSPASRTVIVRAATRLVAAPVTVSLGLLTVRVSPAATLTRAGSGQPLAGRTIVFTTAYGEEICTDTTNQKGRATCNGLVSILSVILGLGYDAAFTGDEFYKPSSASGPLIGLGD